MNVLKKLFGKTREENLLPARCGKTGKDFDIVLDVSGEKVTMAEARKASGSSGSGLGKAMELPNRLGIGTSYRCPDCGNRKVVRCGRCHLMTCYDGSGSSICAYCGHTGSVKASAKPVQIYTRQSGRKSSGSDKPGDKTI